HRRARHPSRRPAPRVTARTARVTPPPPARRAGLPRRTGASLSAPGPHLTESDRDGEGRKGAEEDGSGRSGTLGSGRGRVRAEVPDAGGSPGFHTERELRTPVPTYYYRPRVFRVRE